MDSASPAIDEIEPLPSEPHLALAVRGAQLDAENVSAWFGSNKVLSRVSLSMPPGTVTALIGPSGCGKSTFLRILNRMHELVPSAKMAGEVRLNGQDIYAAGPAHHRDPEADRDGVPEAEPVSDHVDRGERHSRTEAHRV